MRPKDSVTLYTRRDCPLCDEAEATISQIRRKHPFVLHRLDVDADPALSAAYGHMVPVVQINGEDAFYGKVSAVRLAAFLRQSDKPSGPILSPRYKEHLARVKRLFADRNKSG